jgi:hypothetical protein
MTDGPSLGVCFCRSVQENEHREEGCLLRVQAGVVWDEK